MLEQSAYFTTGKTDKEKMEGRKKKEGKGEKQRKKHCVI